SGSTMDPESHTKTAALPATALAATAADTTGAGHSPASSDSAVAAAAAAVAVAASAAAAAATAVAENESSTSCPEPLAGRGNGNNNSSGTTGSAAIEREQDPNGGPNDIHDSTGPGFTSAALLGQDPQRAGDSDDDGAGEAMTAEEVHILKNLDTFLGLP